jgi:hypothetical protein
MKSVDEDCTDQKPIGVQSDGMEPANKDDECIYCAPCINSDESALTQTWAILRLIFYVIWLVVLNLLWIM